MKELINLKILIVDDMETNQRIISNMIKKIGFQEVSFCENGAKALSLIKTSIESNAPFNLIISNTILTDLSSLELVKKIRELTITPSPSFLIYCHESDQASLVDAINEGVDGFIVKPLSIEKFKTKIDLIIKNHFQTKD